MPKTIFLKLTTPPPATERTKQDRAGPIAAEAIIAFDRALALEPARVDALFGRAAVLARTVIWWR